MTVQWKTCSKCQKKVNKIAKKCPYCNSTSFNDSNNFKYPPVYSIKNRKTKKWKQCRNCGENFKLDYDNCPYCNSSLFNLKETYGNLPKFSSLKSITPNPDDSQICPNCDMKISKAVYKCPFCNNTIFDDKVKICQKCGSKINKYHVKCPDCGSRSIEYMNVKDYLKIKENKAKLLHSNEIEENILNDDSSTSNNVINFIEHKLFYYKYDEGFLFSRSKFITILIVILLLIEFFPGYFYWSSFVWFLIISIIVYYSGRLAHNVAQDGEDINSKIEIMGDNLKNNILHFLFYWRNEETIQYKLSKTKIFSLLIYVINVLYQTITSNSFLFALFISLLPFLLALLVGSVIHYRFFDNNNEKETNPFKKEPKVKTIKNKQKKIKENRILKVKDNSIFKSYENEILDLKSNFIIKQDTARELIEKRFPSPQITNTKFNSIVDECGEIFDEKYEVILTIIKSTNEYSSKLDDEIKTNINVLIEINNKLDKLTNELLINISETKNNDVNNLFYEVDMLIDSIKDYE